MNNLDWLSIAQRLQAIAQAGLFYTQSDYDRERYQEISDISLSILEKISDQPVEKIARLFASERDGYRTPKVDIRAVIFNQEGQLLLVKEREDGRWSLPGGWADIGLTPREVAIKEVREEAGLEVSAGRVIGIFDKRCHDHPPEAWYVYKIFIHCQVISGSETPYSSTETTEVGYFSEDSLPPLSLNRNVASQLVHMFRFREQPDQVVYCD
jgi:ADP-ribose pyrophosphatase YjhB (NUDIX family)